MIKDIVHNQLYNAGVKHLGEEAVQGMSERDVRDAGRKRYETSAKGAVLAVAAVAGIAAGQHEIGVDRAIVNGTEQAAHFVERAWDQNQAEYNSPPLNNDQSWQDSKAVQQLENGPATPGPIPSESSIVLNGK